MSRLHASNQSAAFVVGKITTEVLVPQNSHVVLITKFHKNPPRIAVLYFEKKWKEVGEEFNFRNNNHTLLSTNLCAVCYAIPLLR